MARYFLLFGQYVRMARYLIFFFFLHILTYPISFSSFQFFLLGSSSRFFVLFRLIEMFRGGSVVASRTRSKKLKTVMNKPCGEVILLEDTLASRDNKHPLHPAVRFFKIMLTTTLAHGKLKLPKKFTKKFEEGMPNPVFLKPPDGTKWEVHWTKHDDDIWFQKGFKEFATHYSLDHGHLLFFEYEGTSHFDVHIFDNSAVEVDYPCHDGKDNLEEISDHSVETLNEQFSCQKTRRKSTASLPQPCKKMKNGITADVERSPNGVNLDQHAQTTSASSEKAKFVKQSLDEDKSKGIFSAECPEKEQLTSMALNKATTFRSEHPYFTVSLKPSFINEYYLEIPPHFAEKYLKKTHAVFTLEVLRGRNWPVVYSAPRIIGGWQKFVSENNLNVGDVCVFELFQKIQGLAFKVSISRGAEERSCPISLGGSSNQSSSHLESDFKSQILTTTAVDEASTFTSENPFFMITLTPVIGYLNVPMNFVRKHFVNMKRNEIKIQFREKVWHVNYVFYKHASSGRFSAGWTTCARENKLQPRDVCIFELVNREDAILDLHVFRGRRKLMH